MPLLRITDQTAMLNFTETVKTRLSPGSEVYFNGNDGTFNVITGKNVSGLFAFPSKMDSQWTSDDDFESLTKEMVEFSYRYE